MNLNNLPQQGLFVPQRVTLSHPTKFSCSISAKALGFPKTPRYTDELERLESFFAAQGNEAYIPAIRRHYRSNSKWTTTNTDTTIAPVVDNEAIAADVPSSSSSIDQSSEWPAADHPSVFLEQLSTMTREQFTKLQHATQLATDKALAFQEQAASHIQQTTKESIEGLKQHKDTLTERTLTEADRLGVAINAQTQQIKTALVQLKDTTAAALPDIQLPASAEAAVDTLKNHTAASLDTLNVWSGQVNQQAKEGVVVLQQHLATLWQRLLEMVDRLQEVMREGQVTVMEHAHQLKNTVSEAVSTAKTSLSQVQSNLVGGSGTTSTTTTAKTQRTSSPTTASRCAKTEKATVSGPSSSSSCLTASLESLQRTVSSTVSRVYNQAHSAVDTVTGKIQSVKISELRPPSIDVSALQQHVTPRNTSIAATVIFALAAVWRITALRMQSNKQTEDALFAEAQAKARVALKQQRERFKKALVVDEDYSQGSADSSAFKALQARTKNTTTTTNTPTTTTSTTRTSTTLSGDNPFVSSGDELESMRQAVMSGWDTPSLSSDSYTEGDDDDNDVNGGNVVAEEMSNEMKRGWNDFVKRSKMSQGNMWDASDVDEGLPQVWVDLNKE